LAQLPRRPGPAEMQAVRASLPLDAE
jgi:hypothetical protein